MQQSSVIIGALIIGFVLYLAANGRLKTYTNVLWGSSAAAPKPGSSSDSGSSAGGSSADGLSLGGSSGSSGMSMDDMVKAGEIAAMLM